MDLALADQVGGQRGVQQHLDHRAAALAVRGRHQLLGDDGLEVQRQVHPHLAVPVGGEEVDDPLQRLVGVVGVQGGQAQVAGFGEGHGVIHGLAGANFADHDDIRRLAQGVLQGRLEGVGVQPHLALGDDAALVLVDELDRVLDGDDVAGGVLVAVADHRRQRGRLAGAGGADEDHQPALGHRQLLEDFRQLQLFDGRDVGLDAAQHHAHQVALVEGADPEAADAAGADGEVALVVLGELAALLLAHHREHGLAGLFRREGVLGDRQDLAVDLHRGGDASGDEEVGGALFHHESQQFVEFHGPSWPDHVVCGRARGPCGASVALPGQRFNDL
ncbi:hypothetical protein D9M71_348000 [compost metagenome]